MAGRLGKVGKSFRSGLGKVRAFAKEKVAPKLVGFGDKTVEKIQSYDGEFESFEKKINEGIDWVKNWTKMEALKVGAIWNSDKETAKKLSVDSDIPHGMIAASRMLYLGGKEKFDMAKVALPEILKEQKNKIVNRVRGAINEKIFQTLYDKILEISGVDMEWYKNKDFRADVEEAFQTMKKKFDDATDKISDDLRNGLPSAADIVELEGKLTDQIKSSLSGVKTAIGNIIGFFGQGESKGEWGSLDPDVREAARSKREGNVVELKRDDGEDSKSDEKAS